MFNKIKIFFNRMKTFDYSKEQYRGTVKQIMKVRGIRKISLDNYFKWANKENNTGVSSLRLDLQDGYVNIYDANKNEIDSATSYTYELVYNAVNDILRDESNIPYRVRRNILVKLGR